MRLLRVAAFLGAISLAAPAAAQLRPSPLGDIYESYNECFKVATKEGIKPEVLESLGWSRATMSAKDGKPIADAPIIYGHPKRMPMILLSAANGAGACIVMARLKNVSAFEKFKEAWGDQLPKPDAEGAISFFAEGRPIRLRRTGSAKEPSMTIAVMSSAESK